MPEVDALATIRPDDWNLALFLHILGAMVVVGAVVLALIYFAAAWRGEAPESLRAGFRTLLYAGIPGYIVMRGGSEWIYSKEGLDALPTDPDWIGIGYITADAGLLLLLVATITTGIASRRANAVEATTEAAPRTTGVRVSATLCALLLVGYVIAIWAMTAKPA